MWGYNIFRRMGPPNRNRNNRLSCFAMLAKILYFLTCLDFTKKNPYCQQKKQQKSQKNKIRFLRIHFDK